jgi:hypothetical protein
MLKALKSLRKFTPAMSSSKPQFLFILTSHSEMGTSGKKTGWYLVSLPGTWIWSTINRSSPNLLIRTIK